MQMSTVDALSTVIRHELPEQMEQMRRDVERARMEKEDMRSKMWEVMLWAQEAEQKDIPDHWHFVISGTRKVIWYLNNKVAGGLNHVFRRF